MCCYFWIEASGFLFFFLSSFLPPFSSFKFAATPKSLPFMDMAALLESSVFIEGFHTGGFQSVGSVSAPWGQSINLIPLQHDSLSNRLRQLPHLPGIFFFSQSLGLLPKGSFEPLLILVDVFLGSTLSPPSTKREPRPDVKFQCREK